MRKIIVTGGSGLIGSYLIPKLIEQNYQVVILGRTKHSNPMYDSVIWDPVNKKIPSSIFKDAQIIIHLAGANIANGLWTKKRKKLLIDSRVDTLELIYQTLENNPNKVDTLVCASGIGFYGAISQENEFTENEPPANDFLGHCCQEWEKKAYRFSQKKIRVVCLRTAIVFAPKNSAYQKLTMGVSLGLAIILGNGKQVLSWIHIEDICNAYIYVLKNKNISGSYNLASDENISQINFIKKVSKANGKSAWIQIPSFVLKLIMGEKANILLKGSPISNHKIKKEGFVFEFKNIEQILKK